MMQTLLAEIRHAVRRLALAPMFTATAVLTTALSIGANSAIFTFVDATLLRPAAFERPDEVVSVYQDSDDGEPNSSSFPAYRDMEAYEDIFAETMALMPFGATLVRDDGVERLAAEWVTSSYFSFLGLQPTLGRDFEPADDLDGGEPVAILSYAMWQERYGSDPGVLGERLRINGAPVTVVGVGPQGYGGIAPGFKLDLWLSHSAIRPAMGNYAGGTLERRADHWSRSRHGSLPASASSRRRPPWISSLPAWPPSSRNTTTAGDHGLLRRRRALPPEHRRPVAALVGRSDDGRGPDPTDRLLQSRQPAAGARLGAIARRLDPAGARRLAGPGRVARADRERRAGRDRRARRAGAGVVGHTRLRGRQPAAALPGAGGTCASTGVFSASRSCCRWPRASCSVLSPACASRAPTW